jgi:hypothetical protein
MERTISGFHGCDYEKCRLLGCYDVWLLARNIISDESSASIIRVIIVGELGTISATSKKYYDISSQLVSVASYS